MYLTIYRSSSMVRIFLGMGLLLAFGSGGGWFGNEPVDDLNRASGMHGFQGRPRGGKQALRPGRSWRRMFPDGDQARRDSMTTGMRFQSSSRQTAP